MWNADENGELLDFVGDGPPWDICTELIVIEGWKGWIYRLNDCIKWKNWVFELLGHRIETK